MTTTQKCRQTFTLLIFGYSMLKGLPYNSGNELKTITNITHIYTHKAKSLSKSLRINE